MEGHSWKKLALLVLVGWWREDDLPVGVEVDRVAGFCCIYQEFIFALFPVFFCICLRDVSEFGIEFCLRLPNPQFEARDYLAVVGNVARQENG